MMGGKVFTVIDADKLILGRMASIVAKRLLNGERIVIVNAEDAIISGNRKNIIKERKEFLEVGGGRWGPIHWRRPDRLVRRTIRGMLPYRKPRGEEAFKRLRVHIGVPKEFERRTKETLEEAHVSRLRGKFVKVETVAKSVGWNP